MGKLVRRRKWIIIAIVGVTGTMAAALAVRAQERAEAVARGEQVFKNQGCYGCHIVGKFGTPIGPDLSRVGVKYRRDYLVRWIEEPTAVRPAAHMPKLELTPDDIEALAAFLAAQR